MGLAGRQRLVRRVLRAALLLVTTAAMAAAFAASGSHPAVAHHALADNGVISNHD
jgi:hypothetical protein